MRPEAAHIASLRGVELSGVGEVRRGKFVRKVLDGIREAAVMKVNFRIHARCEADARSTRVGQRQVWSVGLTRCHIFTRCACIRWHPLEVVTQVMVLRIRILLLFLFAPLLNFGRYEICTWP